MVSTARKPQSRRSISIRGALHERLSEHCQQQGIAMSAFVEALIAPLFASEGIEAPKVVLVQKLEPELSPQLEPILIQEAVQEPIQVLPAVCKAPAPKPKKPMLKPTKKMLALPLSKVEMPQKDGPLSGYITPIQHW